MGLVILILIHGILPPDCTRDAYYLEINIRIEEWEWQSYGTLQDVASSGISCQADNHWPVFTFWYTATNSDAIWLYSNDKELNQYRQYAPLLDGVARGGITCRGSSSLNVIQWIDATLIHS